MLKGIAIYFDLYDGQHDLGGTSCALLPLCGHKKTHSPDFKGTKAKQIKSVINLGILDNGLSVYFNIDPVRSLP